MAAFGIITWVNFDVNNEYDSLFFFMPAPSQ